MIYLVLSNTVRAFSNSRLNCKVSTGKNWCAVMSATSHLGDSQVGDKPTRRHDNLFPAFHFIFLGLYDIGTSTLVHLWYKGIINFVIRYTAALTWCRHTLARRSVYPPPQIPCRWVKIKKVPNLLLTVLDSLPTLHSSRWVKNKKTPTVGTCWSRE